MRFAAVLLAMLVVLAPVLCRAEAEQAAEGKTKANTRGFEYIELKPGFVVNYGATGRVGFLKADITLRVADAAKAAVAHNMPAIRHELIMLLSRQDETALAAGEPRKTLQTAALEAVRALLVEAAAINAADIQGLLFTTFLTQR